MFGKIITSIITPFTDENKIDFRSFGKLIKKLENEHSEAFVIGGTTGEAPTLTEQELIALLKFSKEIIAKDTKIIAGVGSNNTAKSISQVESLNNLQIDAFLVVVPYFNRPTQEGIYQHFKAISQISKKPIIIYNVPGRTCDEISFSTIKRLVEDCPNIIGLKHSSTNIRFICELKNQMEDFLIYGGEDRYILDVFKNNGDGIISVITNYFGNDVYELVNDYSNNFENVSLYEYIQMISELVFIESSPAPIKYILSKNGSIKNNLRLPLVPLSWPMRQLIDNILE